MTQSVAGVARACQTARMPRLTTTTLEKLHSDQDEGSEAFSETESGPQVDLLPAEPAPQLEPPQPTVRRRRRNVQELTVPDMLPSEGAPTNHQELGAAAEHLHRATTNVSITALSADVMALGEIAMGAIASGRTLEDFAEYICSQADAWRRVRAALSKG